LLPAVRVQGVVRPYLYGQQPVGPLRIWTQGGRVPGLCMTRAMGDWLAASVGLLDEPEVTSRVLGPMDRWVGGRVGGARRRHVARRQCKVRVPVLQIPSSLPLPISLPPGPPACIQTTTTSRKRRCLPL
jgi:hypothetical protein